MLLAVTCKSAVHIERVLHLHCNHGYANAPQCYVIHTLPFLFSFVSETVDGPSWPAIATKSRKNLACKFKLTVHTRCVTALLVHNIRKWIKLFWNFGNYWWSLRSKVLGLTEWVVVSYLRAKPAHKSYRYYEMVCETNVIQQLWFINQPLAQHVSGTIMTIFRSARPCIAAYGFQHLMCWLESWEAGRQVVCTV